jgi:hypothetical protein
MMATPVRPDSVGMLPQRLPDRGVRHQRRHHRSMQVAARRDRCRRSEFPSCVPTQVTTRSTLATSALRHEKIGSVDVPLPVSVHSANSSPPAAAVMFTPPTTTPVSWRSRPQPLSTGAGAPGRAGRDQGGGSLGRFQQPAPEMISLPPGTPL